MRIDAHQHFWKYHAQRDAWMNGMTVLQQDYLPQQLQPLLAQQNLQGCVAVQADQSEEETEFLLQLAEQHTFIKGVVGWVNLMADDVEERLHYYSQFPLLKGFRHIVQAEPNDAFMLQDKFMKGISHLESYGYTYDILIYPRHLPFALQLAAAFPRQPFVIDHLAKPSIKERAIEPWASHIQALAAHTNVFCKVSGMVTEADWENHAYSVFQPYLDVVFSAFGAQRLMYGSDWPVCLLADSYANVCRLAGQYVASRKEEEEEAFFGETATRFYHL